MSGKKIQKFYRDVTVEAGRGQADVFVVLLDGKGLKTPSGAPLHLPSRALAEAVAAEWRSQDVHIRPDTMGLTKLANTAVDRITVTRDAVIEQLLAYGTGDVLCYRATQPEDLVERQKRCWDPLLEWVKARYGVGLETVSGLGFRDQPAPVLQELQLALCAYDDFALAAIGAATTICGSLVLALAIAEGRITAGDAFVAANLDQFFQSERWGMDPEAEARLLSQSAELSDAAHFLAILPAENRQN